MAISLVSQRVPVERWAASHGLGATLAVIDGDLFEALGVTAAPSSVFVRDGRIVGRAAEEIPRRHLLRHVESLGH